MSGPSSESLARVMRNLRLGGGWYALYPPPRAFHGFGDDDFRAAIRHSNGDPIPAQLALHFDIPAAYRSSFCVAGGVPRDPGPARAEAYCERLVHEISLVGSLFDRDRDVVQVSLAPGMARWMGTTHVETLLQSLRRHFHVDRAAGIDLAMTLELDDLATQPLQAWAGLGFNRVGINIASLAARALPGDHLGQALRRVREAGFANVRVEVPYALPGQSDAAFEALVAAVIDAAPERIGLRHCPTQEPDGVPHPSPHERHARLLLSGADALEAGGYRHIGVDLFTRPGDPLAEAQRRGHLYRDALGFGAHGATHLVGFGVGAISQLGGCHAQNPVDQATWQARIDQGRRAADRGVALTEEDQLRAPILQDILCQGRIDVARVELRHPIDFRVHFAAALEHLQPLFEDGSLSWQGDTIQLDRFARLTSQAIASQFDPLVESASGIAPFPTA